MLISLFTHPEGSQNLISKQLLTVRDVRCHCQSFLIKDGYSYEVLVSNYYLVS